MSNDPQNPMHESGPRTDMPADAARRTPSAEAPGFPAGALRAWLHHRLQLNVPVWAIVVVSLVLLGVALD